jgi:hypothetical protein
LPSAIPALEWFGSGRTEHAQVGHQLRAMMNFMLVDAEQNYRDFATKAQARMGAFFVEDGGRTRSNGLERFAMDAFDVFEFIAEAAGFSDHGGQAVWDARFVIGKIGVERDTPDTFFRYPHVPQHFDDGEGAFDGTPVRVFGAEQGEYFVRAIAQGTFLFKKEFL